MSSNADFLKVKGKHIVNGRGESVQLRGVCFAGWLNMRAPSKLISSYQCKSGLGKG